MEKVVIMQDSSSSLIDTRLVDMITAIKKSELNRLDSLAKIKKETVLSFSDEMEKNKDLVNLYDKIKINSNKYIDFISSISPFPNCLSSKNILDIKTFRIFNIGFIDRLVKYSIKDVRIRRGVEYNMPNILHRLYVSVILVNEYRHGNCIEKLYDALFMGYLRKIYGVYIHNEYFSRFSIIDTMVVDFSIV